MRKIITELLEVGADKAAELLSQPKQETPDAVDDQAQTDAYWERQAEIAQANAAAEAHRSRRTRNRVIGSLLVVGAVVGGAAYVANEFGDELRATLPHETSRLDVESSLSQVALRGDTILMSGEGSSVATIDTTSQVCLPFAECYNLPLTSTHSSARVEGSLDVIAESGAVSLQAEADAQAEGGWHVVATVDAQRLTTQLSNAQTQFEGENGLIPELGDIIGIDNGELDRASFLESHAGTNFQAACGPVLGRAMPAATAHYVAESINQTAALLQGSNPEGYQVLTDLAKQPIHLRFVSDKPLAEETLPEAEPTIIAPEDIQLAPDSIDNLDVTIPLSPAARVQYQLAGDSTECQQSEAVSSLLSEYENGEGYVVVRQ